MRVVTFLFLLVSASLAQTIPELLLRPAGEKVRKDVESFGLFTCSVSAEHEHLVSSIVWLDKSGVQVPDEGDRVHTSQLSGGGVELYIRDIRMSDAGQYTCRASLSSGQQVSKTFSLVVYRSIRFSDAPKVQNPRHGTRAKIRCVVNSQPPASIKWFHQGREVTSEARYIVQQDGLSIDNISSQDDGVYVCQAKMVEEGDIKERRITVEVYTEPRITAPDSGTDTQVVEGEGGSLRCYAQGKPEPEIAWTTPEGVDASKTEGLSVREGVLYFSSAHRDMRGQYTCMATNTMGQDQLEFNVSVVVKPYFVQYDNVTVNENATAEMRCVVGGSKPLSLQFQHVNNGINNDNKNEDRIDAVPISEDMLSSGSPSGSSSGSPRVSAVVFDDRNDTLVGVLRVRSVSRSDAGLYRCLATNTAGHHSHSSRLLVRHAPDFDPNPPRRLYTWTGRALNLTCVSHALPNATLAWHFRGSRVVPARDDNLRVFGRGPTSHLQVTPVDQTYYGRYTCHAVNSLGENRLYIELVQVSTPTPPAQVTEQLVTATTIEFSITPPGNDGGLNISSYAVQFKPISSTWNSNESRDHLWPVGSRYVLTDLRPRVNYVFRFAAKNEVGFSEWSREIELIMPAISAPHPPVLLYANSSEIGTNVEVHSQYGNIYTIHWRAGPHNGKPIDSMKLSYHQMKRDEESQWQVVPSTSKSAVIVFPGSHSYRISGLQSLTVYRVELVAHNSLGDSEVASLILTTGSDIMEAAETRQGVGSSVSPVILIVAGVFTLLLLLLLLDITCCVLCQRGMMHKLRERAVSSRSPAPLHLAGKSPPHEDPREKEPLQSSNGHNTHPQGNGDQLTGGVMDNDSRAGIKNSLNSAV